jgi:hypothetical protein
MDHWADLLLTWLGFHTATSKGFVLRFDLVFFGFPWNKEFGFPFTLLSFSGRVLWEPREGACAFPMECRLTLENFQLSLALNFVLYEETICAQAV